MDNKLLFMLVVTGIGIFGSLGLGPFIGILVYYFYAILKPDGIWEFSSSLPKDAGWSFYVAITAMATTAIARLGMMFYPAFGPTRGGRYPWPTAIHAFVALFWVWVTMSYLLAINRDEAHPHYVEYLKMFVMFFVSSLAVLRMSQLWTLLVVLTVADAYAAYEMNFYYFAYHYNYIWLKGYAKADNNCAGLMMAMGIPLCYFLWEATVHRARWLYLLGAGALLHAVLLSFSRGAMLSVLVSGPVLLYFSQRRRWVLCMSALGLACVAATVGPEVRNRFVSISAHEVDSSANSRRMSWMSAVRMANEYPVFGVGVRCSPLISFQYGADQPGRVIHSQYFQIAADIGWVGLLWFLGILFTSMWYLIALWRRTKHWPRTPDVVRTRAMIGALFTSLVIYMVGGAFLSLDHFELPYAFFLIAGQMMAVYRAGGLEALVRNDLSQHPAFQPTAPLLRPKRPPYRPPAVRPAVPFGPEPAVPG